MGAYEVRAPFFECAYDHQQFLFMDWIILLSTFELHGIKSNGTCKFPGWSETEGSACAPVTHITHDKNLVIMWVLVVYCCKAVLCVEFHMGNDFFTSFVVSGVRITV